MSAFVFTIGLLWLLYAAGALILSFIAGFGFRKGWDLAGGGGPNRTG